MKRIVTIAFLIICSADTYSQYTGITSGDIINLKRILETDNQAKQKYVSLKTLATRSLDDLPMPADTILSEGILAGDPKKIKTQISLRDVSKTYAMAMVYAIEGDKKYRDKAISVIRAWATKNKPQGNPINDSKLDAIIESYDMLKNEIDPADNIIIQKWLAELAAKEIQRTRPYNN